MSEPETAPTPTAPGSRPVARGDEGDLFARYADRLVRRVARQVVAPHQTVEDACSFAWVQLLRYQPDRASVLAWLTRVAVREVWTLTAKERRAQLADDRRLDLEGPPVPAADAHYELLERLNVVAGLRQDEGQLLWLQTAGWSLEEIAAHTGHSWRAVCRRIKRARRHLEEADAAEA